MLTSQWRTAVRILCGIAFLYYAVSINLGSIITFIAFIGSIFALSKSKEYPVQISPTLEKRNPLKRKSGNLTISDVPDVLIQKIQSDVYKHITYDPELAESVENFQSIQQNTECIFAKRAKIWGSANWNVNLTLEGNVLKSVPMLMTFIQLCPTLGLDGFVFELPTSKYGKTVEHFGQSVRKLLTILSDNDPSHGDSMKEPNIGKTGWVFKFYNHTFFITTFGPFYSENHSRYGFESENCFVLLQPELSFAHHDLPPDTPETKWETPETIRDKIRVAYRDAGRGYHIRDTVVYPMAHDIVKPLTDKDDVITWWELKIN
ncbi:unnamed protein product [Owenia fusiformis]|uniref:Uncharacterized protein n=1 Tax=Owenia fusiformis TaxID=6347 RepID=A0A8J1TNQ5_OWEFU|nr:unnamed protein product [Owenia fusiformis]